MFDYIMCVVEGIALMFFCFLIFEPRRKNAPRTVLSFAVYILISCLINHINMIAKISVLLVTIILICVMNYRDKLWIIFGYCMHAFYIIIFSDIVVSDIISLFQKTSIMNTILLSDKSKIIFSVVCKVLNFMLFYLSSKILRKIDKALGFSYWLCFDIIAVCYLAIAITFANLFPIAAYSAKEMSLLLILNILFFVTGYLILYLYARICQIKKQEYISNVERLKYESISNQLAVQKHYVEETRKIRHDIKNILQTIGYLNANKQYAEMEEYMKSVSGTMETSDYLYHTDNQFIDAILNLKLRECRSKDITMNTSVEPGLKCNIEPNDIVSLLSNVLDNAIEAVSVLHQNEKNIILKIGSHADSTVVYCENIYKERERKIDFFETDKQDKLIHGFGIGIIKSIVEKYGGNYSFEFKDRKFTSVIVLPNV